jgi:hypothetical protein
MEVKGDDIGLEIMMKGVRGGKARLGCAKI